MNRPDHDTARARIRQLNAIPDRDRTDAEWEELNELEIMLAPGNREGAPDPSRLQQQNRMRGPGGGGGGGGGGQHRRNKKNFQHRRPKGPPQGSPGSQGGGGSGGGGA